MKRRSLIERRINVRREGGSIPRSAGAAAMINGIPPRQTQMAARRRESGGGQASRRSE